MVLDQPLNGWWWWARKQFALGFRFSFWLQHVHVHWWGWVYLCTCVFDLRKESFVSGLFSDLFLFLNINYTHLVFGEKNISIPFFAIKEWCASIPRSNFVFLSLRSNVGMLEPLKMLDLVLQTCLLPFAFSICKVGVERVLAFWEGLNTLLMYTHMHLTLFFVVMFSCIVYLLWPI